MDIPQVLAVLRPGQDWGPCAQTDSNYTALAATWRGSTAVPTLAEMNSAWDTIVANAPIVLRDNTRAAAKLEAAAETPLGQLTRAELLVMMDELNNLRQWITLFKAAIAASTTMANMQTRIAALPSMPDRTASQIKPALVSRIDTTDADP